MRYRLRKRRSMRHLPVGTLATMTILVTLALFGAGPGALGGAAVADGPTSSILDNFNRPDENPLSGGGNWNVRYPSNHLQLLSSQAADTGGNGWARPCADADLHLRRERPSALHLLPDRHLPERLRPLHPLDVRQGWKPPHGGTAGGDDDLYLRLPRPSAQRRLDELQLRPERKRALRREPHLPATTFRTVSGRRAMEARRPRIPTTGTGSGCRPRPAPSPPSRPITSGT